MLKITIESIELFDGANNSFSWSPKAQLTLEHSLVSVSKWESKWCKPFLIKGKKTTEETIDYIRMMTISQNVDPLIYGYLTQENIDEISAYIDAPMTATTFGKETGAPNREIITSELIYFWMVSFNISIECQKWHLNRLLTLIKVFSIKNQPKKKISQKELHARNRQLNDARRQQLNTTG